MLKLYILICDSHKFIKLKIVENNKFFEGGYWIDINVDKLIKRFFMLLCGILLNSSHYEN